MNALISRVSDLAEAAQVMDDVAQGRTWSNKVVFTVSEQARREWDALTEARSEVSAS